MHSLGDRPGSPTALIRRWVQRGLRLLGAAVLAAALTSSPVASAPAQADSSVTCSATINGYTTSLLPDPHVIDVPVHGRINVHLHANQPLAWLYIRLAFADYLVPLVAKEVHGNDWNQDVNVDDYARYGVGLYELYGQVRTVTDEGCAVEVYVKVTGDPLGTQAGDAAAATELVGLVGMGAATVAGAAGGGGAGGGGGGGGDGGGGPSDDWVQQDVRLDPEEYGMRMCYFLALPALLMTGAAMMGGLPPDRPRSQMRLGRVRWRPHLSFLGILGGLLSGIGAMVLLQQYGLVYPHRPAVIAELGGGVLLAIVLPSLMSLGKARRINRRIAAREQALQRQATQGGAGS